MKKAPVLVPHCASELASMALADAQHVTARARMRSHMKRFAPAVRAREHFSAVNEIFEEAKRGAQPRRQEQS